MDHSSQGSISMQEEYVPSVIPQDEPATLVDPNNPQQHVKKSSIWVDIAETIVFALAIFVVVYLFIAQPHQVSGSSMFPNFVDKEYILTDKVSYHLGDPKRGDVIVFRSPTVDHKDYIKRVIGLPREKIKVENGKVFINEQQLPESYLKPTVITQDGETFANGVTYDIPEGKYVVFGDNRPYSSDSRTWGYITKKDIVGKAWLIYWPVSNLGFVPHPKY